MIVHTWKMSRATAAHLHRIRQLLGILLRPRFAHPAVHSRVFETNGVMTHTEVEVTRSSIGMCVCFRGSQ